jgi:hypothetical protein
VRGWFCRDWRCVPYHGGSQTQSHHSTWPWPRTGESECAATEAVPVQVVGLSWSVLRFSQISNGAQCPFSWGWLFSICSWVNSQYILLLPLISMDLGYIIFCHCLIFGTRTPCVAQVGLELKVLLPQASRITELQYHTQKLEWISRFCFTLLILFFKCLRKF